MADRVLSRLQKRTHVFENKKAKEKRNARARTCIRQLDAGVSLSRAVKLGPGERHRHLCSTPGVVHTEVHTDTTGDDGLRQRWLTSLGDVDALHKRVPVTIVARCRGRGSR